MSAVNTIREWLRQIEFLINRRRHEEALREEMAAHRAAMAHPDRFGHELRLREAARDVWGWRWLDDLLHDLRYAARSLARHPAFTLTALSTLAVAIGAATAIFTVVNGVVLRPLPFADPDRLVQMYGTSSLGDRDAVGYLDTYRRENRSFDALVGYGVGARYLRDDRGAERVMTVQTERQFFSMLGVAPVAGRTFRPDDIPAVAVVSELFANRLGGIRLAVGRMITLDDQPITIIGVMPAWFQFPYGAASLLPGIASETRTDLWTLFGVLPVQRRINSVTGRLKPGVQIAAAESELAAIARRLEAQDPASNAGRGVRLEPLSEVVVSPAVRRALFALFGAVGLVLALACANVANLSLARMTRRGREVAVRAAIGAGRGRLVRQFLTESLFLSVAGGAIGLLLAVWSTQWLLRLAGPHLPRAHEVTLDWSVFSWMLAACAGSGAALAIVPATFTPGAGGWLLWSAGPQSVASTSTMSRAQKRLRDGLVVAEIALAFVLAAGAVMLVRELTRLRGTESGMVTANAVTFHVGQRMAGTDVRQFYDIADRVSQLPGVRAAGFIQLLPLQNWGWTSNSSDFQPRGRPPLSPVFPIQLRYVTPGYFAALGIPITRGRGLTAADLADAPQVIVINQTLARRAFGDADPIGVATTRGTIVGVVADVRQATLDRTTEPEIYYPAAQNWSQVSELGMTLVVSTGGGPEPLIEPVRSVVRSVNPNLAVFNVRTMDQVVADSLSDFTLYLSLMAAFALIALVLATTGTLGVISYIAGSRTREFAIQAALGATRRRLTGLVVNDGARMTFAGIALGLIGAAAAAPMLNGLPVYMRPPDVAALLLVALLLGSVAMIACLVPALRAARVDPMAVLRND